MRLLDVKSGMDFSVANSQVEQPAHPGEAAEPAAEQDSRAARLRALGAEIRALRRGRDLSTVALARACGVSPSLISQVERGLTAPSLEVLWAIARALDVPIGTFFQPDGDAPAEPAAVAESGADAGPPPRAIVVRADRLVNSAGRGRLQACNNEVWPEPPQSAP
jgi:transcriptional regulator with XRE-family HTH domain